MAAEDARRRFHELISKIDLPSPSAIKFDKFRDWLAEQLDLDRSEVRAYAVSKAGNLDVRFRQPGMKTKPRVGVAVVTGKDFDACVAPARRLVEGDEVDVIALAKQSGGRWSVESVVSSDASVAQKLAEIWPQAALQSVPGAAERTSEHVARTTVDTGCFTGFQPEAFRFLAELRDNNNATWFDANRERFGALLREPLRCLVEALGPLMLRIDPGFETRASSPETMSKIRRMPGAQGTYRYHYWAAFTRRAAGRKLDDVQLYVTLSPEGLHHGLYFGEGPGARTLIQRFRELTVKRRDEVVELLKDCGLPGGFIFAGRDPWLPKDGYPIDDPDSLARWAGESFPRIHHLDAPEDPVVTDPVGLIEHLMDAFAQLWPVFVMTTTTAEDPISAARAALETEVEEEESDEETPISWPALVAATCLEEAMLRRIERALVTKRQIVLSGPPGTGKTWVGLHVAEYFAETKDRVELVQFHPSYSYEDFIEGIRATTVVTAEGRRELDYRVQDGIFKLLCSTARKFPDKRHVLVVDEINRGNVARIFGELLFLLEYRERAATLSYSREVFQLPSNVYLIGTMNTADRSIALVDFALRRRFRFIEMAPDRSVLECWLTAHDAPLRDVTLDLYETVNAPIIDADYKIGHTYFMARHTAESLADLWELELKPYLREYFFATQDRVRAVEADVEAVLARARKAS